MFAVSQNCPPHSTITAVNMYVPIIHCSNSLWKVKTRSCCNSFNVGITEICYSVLKPPSLLLHKNLNSFSSTSLQSNVNAEFQQFASSNILLGRLSCVYNIITICFLRKSSFRLSLSVKFHNSRQMNEDVEVNWRLHSGYHHLRLFICPLAIVIRRISWILDADWLEDVGWKVITYT